MSCVTEPIADADGAHVQPKVLGRVALMYSKYWQRRGASEERQELGALEFPHLYFIGAARASREKTSDVSMFLQPVFCPAGSMLFVV